jgi:hypothetical protein
LVVLDARRAAKGSASGIPAEDGAPGVGMAGRHCELRLQCLSGLNKKPQIRENPSNPCHPCSLCFDEYSFIIPKKQAN